jgi:hypothetical protein
VAKAKVLTKLTKHGAFLAAFSICGRIREAARAAMVCREVHHKWMRERPEYPALFAEAKQKAAENLEDEAVERATVGVFEPTTYQGKFVFPVIGQRKDAKTGELKPIFSKVPYGIWKKSDRLLEFLLKGQKPEVYRERQSVEHSGTIKTEYKFKGSLEELLDLYRDLKLEDEAKESAKEGK